MKYRIALLMLIGMVAVAGCSGDAGNENEAAVAQGLVAYYPFDGDTKDYSGYDNHGTPTNVGFLEGRFGQALEVKGGEDSYVQVEHSDQLEIHDALSVSFWMREHTRDGPPQCLIYKSGAEPDTSGMEEPVPPDTVFADRNWTIWATSLGNIHFTSVPEGLDTQRICNTDKYTYPAFEFCHVVCIIDTEDYEMRVYINGELSKTCTYGQYTISSGPYPLRIGGMFKSFTDQVGFEGRIDEVRIYNRVLNEEEILSLYEKNALQ